MAKIIIDGQEHECEEGRNLFEVIQEAKGTALPHFCYHPGLSVAGVCRMCQVELEGAPKPIIACNAVTKDGMEVRTETDRIKNAVQQILNFHLLHHPVDCPVCDQAGECSLQDLYMNHGLYEATEDIDTKLRKDKVKPIGELVMLDAERCVLCARCTRFTDEITGTHELGIFNRGNHSEIDVAPGQTLDNNYSLNTVDICPVGALTSRDFRFKRRVWWLETTESVCPGCATGCSMVADHSEGIVYRFKPRHNPHVNDYWMCDHGRLLYHRITDEDRLSRPVTAVEDGRDEVSWDDAWAEARRRFRAPDGSNRDAVVVGSPHATLEELLALERLSEAVGAEIAGFRLVGSEMDEGDDLLLSADRTPNAEGAKRMGWKEFDAQELRRLAGEEKVLVVLNNDLASFDEEMAEIFSGFSAVLVLETHRSATADLADVVLPVACSSEIDGTFVNRKGRAQRVRPAVAPPGETQDAIAVIRDLGELLGHQLSFSSAEDLRRELVSTREGFGAMAEGIGPLGVELDINVKSGVPSGSEGSGE